MTATFVFTPAPGARSWRFGTLLSDLSLDELRAELDDLMLAAYPERNSRSYRESWATANTTTLALTARLYASKGNDDDRHAELWTAIASTMALLADALDGES